MFVSEFGAISFSYILSFITCLLRPDELLSETSAKPALRLLLGVLIGPLLGPFLSQLFGMTADPIAAVNDMITWAYGVMGAVFGFLVGSWARTFKLFAIFWTVLSFFILGMIAKAYIDPTMGYEWIIVPCVVVSIIVLIIPSEED